MNAKMGLAVSVSMLAEPAHTMAVSRDKGWLYHTMSKIIVLAILLICAATSDAKAETAEEVQSWCQGIVHAKIFADGRVGFEPGNDTEFCWGAFAAIQEIVRYPIIGMDHTYLFCPPADSTRSQLIKVFSHYVDDHPAISNLPFMDAAYFALTKTFPCDTARPR